MQAAEIMAALKECGLPLAYRQFPEGSAPGLPYAVWYIGGETNFPADGENYHNVKQITVELYTGLKDPDTEAAVEVVLNGLGIWEKTEEYVDSEKCYQIVYYLEV